MIRIIVFMALVLFAAEARAHDTDPVVDEWMRTLMQPDHPQTPCCGIADAYWADELHVRKDSSVFAIVTDDREDKPLNGRHHVPVGTIVEVPNEKLTWKDGNPSGHAVVFLDINNQVLCYVQGGGI